MFAQVIPRPMVHEASAETKTAIMEVRGFKHQSEECSDHQSCLLSCVGRPQVYEKIHETSDREERKKLREKMEHLQVCLSAVFLFCSFF